MRSVLLRRALQDLTFGVSSLSAGALIFSVTHRRRRAGELTADDGPTGSH